MSKFFLYFKKVDVVVATFFFGSSTKKIKKKLDYRFDDLASSKNDCTYLNHDGKLIY